MLWFGYGLSLPKLMLKFDPRCGSIGRCSLVGGAWVMGMESLMNGLVLFLVVNEFSLFQVWSSLHESELLQSQDAPQVSPSFMCSLPLWLTELCCDAARKPSLEARTISLYFSACRTAGEIHLFLKMSCSVLGISLQQHEMD